MMLNRFFQILFFSPSLAKSSSIGGGGGGVEGTGVEDKGVQSHNDQGKGL